MVDTLSAFGDSNTGFKLFDFDGRKRKKERVTKMKRIREQSHLWHFKQWSLQLAKPEGMVLPIKSMFGLFVSSF